MPKYKLWFTLSLLVALIALGGAWLYNRSSFTLLRLIDGAPTEEVILPPEKKVEKKTEENTPVVVPEVIPTSTLPVPVESIPPVSKKETPTPAPSSLGSVLSARASFFVERYATFSSVRPYENISSLKDYLTNSFWQFLEMKASSAQATTPATGYVAKVIGTQVIKIDEISGVAEINVPLIRQSFSGDVYSVGEMFNMLVKFKKINNQWLVDGAYWN